MSKLFFLAILALLAPGCSDDSVTCTKELRASVRLLVLDAAGELVSDADARYTVDGDIQRSCTGGAEGPYICGLEEQGRFVITVARGGEQAEGRVTVRADVCHVITEDVTVTLESAS